MSQFENWLQQLSIDDLLSYRKLHCQAYFAKIRNVFNPHIKKLLILFLFNY